MRSLNFKNRFKKCVILQILRSDFEKSLIRMIAVHRPTCWNWNIRYLIFFWNHESSISENWILCTNLYWKHSSPLVHLISSKGSCGSMRSRNIKNRFKKSANLEILRSDFEKSLIRMIAVHRSTCWNWNIGYLIFFWNHESSISKNWLFCSNLHWKHSPPALHLISSKRSRGSMRGRNI